VVSLSVPKRLGSARLLETRLATAKAYLRIEAGTGRAGSVGPQYPKASRLLRRRISIQQHGLARANGGSDIVAGPHTSTGIARVWFLPFLLWEE